MATTSAVKRATREQALEERGLIRSQMRLGSALIAFGALSIPMFQVSDVLQGEAATAAFGVAMAVIGAGAAMLPTGAAASASARILRTLPDQDAVAGDQPAVPGNGQVPRASASSTSSTPRSES
jgi:F420-dependent methylenetetrahydromethanopterin dehydrogenase